MSEHGEQHGPGGRGLEGGHEQEDPDLVRTERPEVLDDLLELRHDDDDDDDDRFLCVLGLFFNSTFFMQNLKEQLEGFILFLKEFIQSEYPEKNDNKLAF